ncbi:MAG: universal stress protein [Desulfobacteraceae bacterium]|nr:universal stress protein [Desulfobacteraceae bacterium]
MATVKKRILLLVDGSSQSSEMVAYISKIYVLWQTEIVLFNVLDSVPESFWDWEKDPLGPQYVSSLKDWENRKEAKILDFIESTRQVLINAGALEKLIRVKVQKRQTGIARDVIAEAKSGYDAVALGRRGLGAVAEPALGGVASKLLGTLTNIPLCIVSGQPKLGRILVGLDNSAGSQRAAVFVGKHLGASEPSITLAHVIRNPERTHPDLIAEEYAQKILESAQSAIVPVFNKVTRSLKTAGIKSSKINTKVITGVGSRAGALFDEATHGGFGTLVIGRRGISEVVQFQMGRVAAKLTQISNQMALWIIA